MVQRNYEMRLSVRKLRRAVFAILTLVSFNAFGVGWWWLRNNGQTNNVLSPSSHIHVPHPMNHLQENWNLHYQLHGKNRNSFPKTNTKKEKKKKPETQGRESLLNCSLYGGPYDYDSVEEMVYWKDIPQDTLYKSRYKHNGSNQNEKDRRFLTFEPDVAGFNNQRMVFEINLIAAIVTGRTLVVPRGRPVAHLASSKQNKIAMHEFFDLPSIAAQMPDALDIMSIDEFIRSEGGPNKLHIPTNFTGFYERTESRRKHETLDSDLKWDINTNGTNYHDTFLLKNLDNRLGCSVRKLGKDGCSNYTDWIKQYHMVPCKDNGAEYKVYFLDEYLMDHPKIFSPRWGAYKCMLVIPDHNDDSRYASWLNASTAKGHDLKAWWTSRNKFVGNPVAVDATAEERLAQLYWMRDGICVYGNDMHSKKYWHMGDRVDRDSRLIGHWYDYLHFEDWKEDLWVKRFLRDKVRYPNEIQCAAARIVEALRNLARHANGNSTFHTMHIRRTDLTVLYQKWGVDKNASEIFEEFSLKRNIIPRDSVVYIATDEKDKSFFDIFRERYRAVYFFDDFTDLLGPEFPTQYYGMVEQLVCSKGEHFLGTFYSTFTGYINRLRGYHSQKQKPINPDEEKRVLEEGRIPSWFYAPREHIENYQHFTPIGSSLFEMEYALAWRNIDYDVDPVLREKVDRIEATKAKNRMKTTRKVTPEILVNTSFLPSDGFVAATMDKPIQNQTPNTKIKSKTVVGFKKSTIDKQ